MIECGGRGDPISLIGGVAGGGSRCEVEFPGGSSPAIAVNGGPGDGRVPIQFLVQTGDASAASPGAWCSASSGIGKHSMASVLDPPSGRGYVRGDPGPVVADCDEPSASGGCPGDDETVSNVFLTTPAAPSLAAEGRPYESTQRDAPILSVRLMTARRRQHPSGCAP